MPRAKKPVNVMSVSGLEAEATAYIDDLKGIVNGLPDASGIVSTAETKKATIAALDRALGAVASCIRLSSTDGDVALRSEHKPPAEKTH